MVEKGVDTTNLGRWSWTHYRGKNNQTLRIISAYRPNHPNWPFTVYAQQNAFFHSIGSPRCPRKAFLQDLCKDINNFLESGDKIILMLDGNSNMRQSDLTSALESCTFTVPMALLPFEGTILKLQLTVLGLLLQLKSRLVGTLTLTPSSRTPTIIAYGWI